MIRIRNLKKVYRRGDEEVVACDVTALDVERGEHVAIVGKSGLGKTTLLNIVSGIVRPTSGEVRVADVDVGSLGEAKRDRFRGEHIGIVFQTFNLLVPFTALENVLLGAVFAGGADATVRDRAVRLLGRVGLGDRIDHYPNQMSVGQVQRVALCRALINGPDLILADEPLGNQDRETGAEALRVLREIAEEEKRTVVMVTHDPASAELMHRTIDLSELRTAS
ncbi:MAG: ABC transporter ATP-binding protein [Planctomycetes bacterium]|nr:ABC transporter ATP-binding protein [Planctomycetota bacterium]